MIVANVCATGVMTRLKSGQISALFKESNREKGWRAEALRESRTGLSEYTKIIFIHFYIGKDRAAIDNG